MIIFVFFFFFFSSRRRHTRFDCDWSSDVCSSDLERMPRGAWFNVAHLCGSNLHFGLARDLPAQAISWSVHNQGNPTLAEGRRLSGRAVMGGLGQRTTLLYGPPPEIE